MDEEVWLPVCAHAAARRAHRKASWVLPRACSRHSSRSGGCGGQTLRRDAWSCGGTRKGWPGSICRLRGVGTPWKLKRRRLAMPPGRRNSVAWRVRRTPWHACRRRATWSAVRKLAGRRKRPLRPPAPTRVSPSQGSSAPARAHEGVRRKLRRIQRGGTSCQGVCG